MLVIQVANLREDPANALVDKRVGLLKGVGESDGWMCNFGAKGIYLFFFFFFSNPQRALQCLELKD